MADEYTPEEGQEPDAENLVEIDLSFASMRRFQAEFSQNLATDGLFIDTGEPLGPGSVVRFRVILPEDFVYVEGTGVVEWSRSAEAAGEGVPGMALRFVAMSPQNQELVEQLVEAHVESGGAPFDLDYRPPETDYPTDALEGLRRYRDVTGGSESPSEKYRVTIRSKENDVTEAALQALVEADPAGPEIAGEEEPGGRVDDPEDDAEPGGSTGIGAMLDSLDIGRKSPIEPEIEVEAEDEPEGPTGEEESAEEPPPATFEEDDPREQDPQDGASSESFDPLSLEAPVDPEEGPEAGGEIGVDEGIGSPAFDVSLPMQDDEPDTTPVLPDDGGDDITVAPPEATEPAQRTGRGWVLSVVAIVVVAAAVVVWWPTIVGWIGGLVEGDPEPAAVEETVAETLPAPDDATIATTTDAPDEAEVETEEPRSAGDDVGSGVDADEPAYRSTADTVIAVDFEARDGATVVMIRGNGSLEEGSINLSSLPSPPRALIKIVGISNDYRPYAIEVGSTEMTRIRIGHHEETRPPELWVVLDLAAPGVAVTGVDIRGDTAELVIARR
jgi:uncharacterized protein (TIGR02266 family)